MPVASRRLWVAFLVIAGLVVALVVPLNPVAADTNEATVRFQAAASKITAGGSHSCAVENDGDVYCWGDNYAGQLGNSTNTGTNTANPTPAKVTLPVGAADRHHRRL